MLLPEAAAQFSSPDLTPNPYYYGSPCSHNLIMSFGQKFDKSFEHLLGAVIEYDKIFALRKLNEKTDDCNCSDKDSQRD